MLLFTIQVKGFVHLKASAAESIKAQLEISYKIIKIHPKNAMDNRFKAFHHKTQMKTLETLIATNLQRIDPIRIGYSFIRTLAIIINDLLVCN